MKIITTSGVYSVILWICNKVIFIIISNKSKENVYCDKKSRIFNSLKRFLQESLLLRPIIILIALFCILKNFELWVEFPQNIIP
jgi:hypothetical protein